MYGHSEATIIEAFDLLEFQKKARETCDPKRLFELWEDVCRRYDRREIGAYELEEMKEVILPNLQALAGLRRSINDIDSKPLVRRLKKRA
jgi:hypothetical protein